MKHLSMFPVGLSHEMFINVTFVFFLTETICIT